MKSTLYFLKRIFALVCLLCSLHCHAQQNLFNVPTSDITAKKKLFYQQQFNITSNLLQFNTTFSYGLGKNMEVGFNVIAFDLNLTSNSPRVLTNDNKSNPPEYPLYTMNFQKAFVVSKGSKIAIGTQTGVGDSGEWGSYIYSNFVNVISRTKTKIITGVYWASDSFLGPNERLPVLATDSHLGIQTGVEQPFFDERLFLIAENISGLHSLGETSLGGAWKFTKHWVWSMAYQFPNKNGTASKALVVELTYVP